MVLLGRPALLLWSHAREATKTSAVELAASAAGREIRIPAGLSMTNRDTNRHG